MNYRPIIESRYNRTDWQSLLYDIFRQKVQFWQQPQLVAVDESMAKSALYTGKITLPDGHVIAVYEVELSDSVVIERNCAGIRNLLCINWRGMGCSGAFMFCYRQNEAVLRFSYVSESFAFTDDGAIKKESTDTKRFTYLLGEGHRSRTAIEQFEKLKASGLTLKDLTKAFSVEALSDSFFREYKKQYEDIIEFITGKRMVKVDGKWKERVTGVPCREIMQEFSHFPDAEKAVRDYVKKLMGRLVFIQFLQKKGWMGCSAGEAWNDGDKEFVQNLFVGSPYKNTFVDDVLEPLFNDINTRREGDIANAILGNGIKVPYLNGGLFEKDDYDKTAFPLPARFMKSMLDFFASYNFTIDENDPDDAEIGVDPEMLGRIFENLLEDNKDKGAFYTPKEIVQYMCRESLIAYLQTGIEDENTKSQIRTFVTTNYASPLSPELATDIDQRLKDVKICDPAIGSGAFPMGLLRELYACRKAIEGIENDNAVKIKTHIIQNNIYGVDIEKGAVDIARLRFWLALIVDEKTPHALPNMDFKIMQGNSLLEQYEGVDLSGMSLNEQARQKYRQKKEKAWQQTLAFDENDALNNIQNAIREYYLADEHQRKSELRNIINTNVKNYILNLKGCTPDIQQKLETLPIPNDQFFLWHIYFKEVFDNGGFDIVIGNPPYIEAKKLKHIASTLKTYFKVYTGTSDISAYFIELGTKLAKEQGGILSYITTNKFFNTEYGKSVREHLLERKINQLINFEQVEVFEGVLVSSVIMMSTNRQTKSGETITYEKFYKLNAAQFRKEFIERTKNGTYPQELLDENEWSFSDVNALKLKRKIEEAGSPVKDLTGVSVFRGVTTGFNPAFIIDDTKRDELIAADPNNRQIIKKLLQGRNIRKWYYNESDENLIFIPWHFPLQDKDISGASNEAELAFKRDFPELYNHFLSYHKDLSSRNQDETGIRYEWYALQRCAASYFSEFEKPKIIWGLTADKWAYTIDRENHYLPSNGYIMTSKEIPLEYLLGVLNSNVLKYYFGFIGVMTAGGAYTLKAATIESLPIPKASSAQQQPIISLVETILNKKRNGKPTEQEERDIDLLVYRLYGLTYDEVRIINPDTDITEEEYGV